MEPFLIDLRAPSLFARGFIPGSVNIPNLECFELLISSLELPATDIYVISRSLLHRHAAALPLERFAGIRIAGWLKPDVVHEWRRSRGPLASFEELAPDHLAVRIAAWKTVVVDVRSRGEFRRRHIPDSVHLPLDKIRQSVSGLPEETSLSVVCESGDRAAFAGSLFWNLGFRHIATLRGGFQAYLESGLPVASDEATK